MTSSSTYARTTSAAIPQPWRKVMIHVSFRLTVREARRIWDALETAEYYLKNATGTTQKEGIVAKVLADARHDYADLQARLGDAIDSYNPFLDSGGAPDVEGAGEGGSGL